MKIDLYKILDINETATKEEIKKAFRKKAKSCHPDHQGGNSDKFSEINEAHAILINDKKRKLYDETGQTDDNLKSKIIGAAHDRLSKFFLEIIAKKKDAIFQTDIINLIEKNIFNFIKQNEGIIYDMKNEEKHLKKIKKKIKYKGRNVNLFSVILEDKIKHCKFTIYQAKFDIKIFNKMSKMLKDFEFKFDKTEINNSYIVQHFKSTANVNWKEF